MIQWQKSTFSSGSDGSNCVGIALVNDELLVRESDDPTQVLTLTRSGLAALLQQIRTERP